MASLTLNSNIASGLVQRQLTRTTSDLQRSFERLSTGLRINRASDDAAGLAIASSLGLDSRVYTQGVRNGNDAIGVLNTAEGAAQQLSNIVIRLKELAEQAANGTLTLSQRKSLDREGASLTNEFNRITQTTKFNGLNLLGGNLGMLNIQVGYGTDGQIGITPGQGLERNSGVRLATATSWDSGGVSSSDTGLADFNGDGKLDLVTAHTVDGIQIVLGDGSGSFAASPITSLANSAATVTTLDINKDGKSDIVFGTNAGFTGYALGVGDGTFQAVQAITVGGGVGVNGYIEVADFNGDGNMDVAGANAGGNSIRVMYGNGSGFSSGSTVAGLSNISSIRGTDLNNDGKADLVWAGLAATGPTAHLSTGNSFASGVFSGITGLTAGNTMTTGDFNLDGYEDVAVYDNLTFRTGLAFGNGDGTFTSGTTLMTGSLGVANATMRTGDFNNDGYLDLIGSGSITRVWKGNGDGTFAASVNIGTGVSTPASVSFGDLDGDGVLDFVGADGSSAITIQLATTAKVTSMQRINLLTQANARQALGLLDDVLERITKEIGNIGSAQSRLGTALNTLFTARENSDSAASRIKDVDVAEESATLVRTQILQNAGAAILKQANLQPSIALSLLRS